MTAIILGLGSNIGHRIAHLREALCQLEKISELQIEHYSPVYESDALLPDAAPAGWDQPYLNMAVRCVSSLSPAALLAQLKAIEQAMGRSYYARWSPRIIDIDILAWGTLRLDSAALTIPHPELEKRPFALWPLLDVMPEWTCSAPASWGRQRSIYRT